MSALHHYPRRFRWRAWPTGARRELLDAYPHITTPTLLLWADPQPRRWQQRGAPALPESLTLDDAAWPGTQDPTQPLRRAMVLLPRLVGRGMAMELLTTGRQVKAEEALRIGLANHVVPPDQLLAKGLELARMVAGKAPIAVRVRGPSEPSKCLDRKSVV